MPTRGLLMQPLPPPALRHSMRVLALCVLGWMLSACTTAPKPTPQPTAPPPPQATPSAQPPASNPYPQTGPRGGAYYKDDGPGTDAPPNLEQTPDAQPKIEGLLRGPNRPYVVFGKNYTPQTSDQPLRQTGLGSWYGRKFHGQRTSSGEIYNMYAMTAAHPTMLLPSYARVTNLENGKVVIVRVNDRGPFHQGRVIDLSYTAALKLGYVAKGSAQVLVERLTNPEIARMQKEGSQSVEMVAQATPAPAPARSAPTAPAPVVAAGSSIADPQAILERDFSQGSATSNTSRGTAPADSTPIALPTVAQASTATSASRFFLQLGAFGHQPNAQSFSDHMQRELAQVLEGGAQSVSVVPQGNLFRSQLGPFETREQAQAMAERVRQLFRLNAVIVGR